MLVECSFKKKIFVYFPFFLLIIYIRENIIIYFDLGYNDIFIYHLSRIFMIIFYIFEKYLSKGVIKSKNNDLLFINSNEVYQVIQRKPDNQNTKIIIILCFFLFNLIYEFISLKFKELTQYNMVYLILFLVNNIFFEKNIYSHQLLSIIINILSLIYGTFYLSIKLYMLIFHLLGGYAECFSYLLIKYINTQYYINVYLLGSLEGISLLMMYFIMQLIFNENIIELNELPIYKYFFTFLIFFSFFFLKYKVILELNPFYYFFMDNVSYFICIIINNPKLSDIIQFSIIFLSSLIYIEIIQLNFCGLSDNTTKRIMERSKSDVDSILSNLNNNETLIGISSDLFDFSKYDEL